MRGEGCNTVQYKLSIVIILIVWYYIYSIAIALI